MQKLKEFMRRLVKDSPGLFQLSVINPETYRVDTTFLPAEAFKMAAETWALVQGHVFFSPNPRVEPSGKDSAVKAFTSFFIDFDSGDRYTLWRRIKEFPFPPSAIVFSGRGYHTYWFFKEAEELNPDFYRGVQRGLAEFFASDPTIFNPARLMRLPGSVNPKNGKRAEVKYLAENEYNASDFEPFYRKVETFNVSYNGKLKIAPVKREEILKLKVSRKTKQRILKGSLEGVPSRSERDIRIVRALLAAKVPEQKILAIFLNPDLGCSDKVREKGRDGLRYLLFTLEKAKRYAEKGLLLSLPLSRGKKDATEKQCEKRARQHWREKKNT